MKLKKYLPALAAAAILAGCAEVPQGAGENPADPWEKMNRQTNAFNYIVDTYTVRPVAKAYIKVVPQGARDSVNNVFENMGEPKNALNNALQGKGERTLASVFRFLINTSFGLGGLFDVAGSVGNQPVCKEDFGQTLRVWGVPQGPYVVLPFLGPSTVTDAAGSAVGWYTEPFAYAENDYVKWGWTAADLFNLRVQMMPLTDGLRDAVDPYVMAREGYLAHRTNVQYDGNPPVVLLKDEFEDEDDEKAPVKKESK